MQNNLVLTSWLKQDKINLRRDVCLIQVSSPDAIFKKSCALFLNKWKSNGSKSDVFTRLLSISSISKLLIRKHLWINSLKILSFESLFI